MGKKGMIQWAPGTRPQKMNRNDGVWQIDMAALKKRVEEREKGMDERGKKDPGFKKGDLVISSGQVFRAGDIDPNGHWVMLGIHRTGTDIVAKYPEEYVAAYLHACELVGQEPT